jgi:hypothetical protein
MLDDKEIRHIDRYWRAANYVSVGQIYLMDNPLPREHLKAEHVKPRRARPRRASYLRARAWRTCHGRQHVARSNLQRGLS